MSRPRSVAVRPAVSISLPVAVLGSVLLLTGCASKEAAAPQASVAPVKIARVEIEDDGLPAQLAPRNRRPGADDPSQPWSPNYGTGLTVEKPRPVAGQPIPSQFAAAPLPPNDPDAALAAARAVLNRMQQPPHRAVAPQTAQQSPSIAQPGNAQVADQAAALAQARRVIAAMQAQKAQTEKAPPTRLSGVDEDMLVRRAIAEHEMRRAD